MNTAIAFRYHSDHLRNFFMKYNAPFGSSDPDAGYVDRNTPGAVSGSRVPAAALEDPQREIMAVINAAGIAPSDADLTQLLQAINNLIASATGGGGDSNYVLMTQARVRLPIYPEILTSDGTLPVTSPSTGQVRVPAGYNLLHRGIFNVTTVQTDFATVANKVYHLRWSSASGFALKDTADVAYNPGSLPEINALFDSGYDDMLVAKVVTNASNVSTITLLANKARLVSSVQRSQTHIGVASNQASAAAADTPILINWARSPQWIVAALETQGNSVASSFDVQLESPSVPSATRNRYGLTVTTQVFNPYGSAQSIVVVYEAHARA
jgi:hypothetical protein